MLGKSLREQGFEPGLWPEGNLVAVKAPVFSMSKLIGVDTFLGPEMKSTGEVMGVDFTFEAAVRKALIASDLALRPGTPVLLSLSDRSKPEAVPLIYALQQAGCPLYATEGSAAMIRGLGIPVTEVTKLLHEGHPNVVDLIRAGTVGAVLNTLEGGRASHMRDGFHIRRAATETRIPCFTSIDTARAAIQALSAPDSYSVHPLLHYRDGTRNA
jgi:carbamoyl-phosphate synthase large subunit